MSPGTYSCCGDGGANTMSCWTQICDRFILFAGPLRAPLRLFVHLGDSVSVSAVDQHSRLARCTRVVGDGDFYDSLNHIKNVLRKDLWVIGACMCCRPSCSRSRRVWWSHRLGCCRRRQGIATPCLPISSNSRRICSGRTSCGRRSRCQASRAPQRRRRTSPTQPTDTTRVKTSTHLDDRTRSAAETGKSK